MRLRKIICLILLSCFLLAGVVVGAGEDEPINELLVRGKIIKVIKEKIVTDPLSRKPTFSYLLKVRVTSGKFSGRAVLVEHYETSNPIFNIKVAAGDRVVLSLETTGYNGNFIKEAYIVDHLREPQINFLLVIFLIIVLAIGWRKGAKAITSLLLTLVLIWGLLLPGILKGYHPVLLTVVVSLLATIITIIIVGGFSIKSAAAILGTFAGVTVSGCLALTVGKWAHLTGFGSEEAAMLL